MNGTRFEQKSFTVPAGGKGQCDRGHMEADVRGKCMRCGVLTDPKKAERERESERWNTEGWTPLPDGGEVKYGPGFTATRFTGFAKAAPCR